MEKEQMIQMLANSTNVSNAIDLANQIESDPTMGGTFPNGGTGDFQTINEQKFKDKWCKHWTILEPLLQIAKIFTGDKGDKAIDAIILTANTLCNKL